MQNVISLANICIWDGSGNVEKIADIHFASASKTGRNYRKSDLHQNKSLPDVEKD